jgi:hypothetical protein
MFRYVSMFTLEGLCLGVCELVDGMLTRQFHQTQQHIKALEPLLEASGGTMKMSGWDGAAEFWAESAEDFVGFMKGVYGAKELVGKSLSRYLGGSRMSRCLPSEHCVPRNYIFRASLVYGGG